ncbi:PREDICTED: NF-kappa-B inhibitor cactus [Nicrophorus vespilloides]|uniref:NF-kappa-B inhibitor cactus n=1 Tax=Nicrophorus vespilloides TaxID=110193 RepID=A0ABM1MIH0_NICVS|nr:PREDICTED: NF-kappa-B inhibitor cactus [Nicrophorus vespilloides]XP_017774371.1 PREDICTED: NF-kappa-B inhibitor cactus [Nicrophorus vespilloides]
MSGPISDTQKLTSSSEDEKYLESSRTDSGFLSSGNLLLSSSEIIVDTPSTSHHHHHHSHQQQHHHQIQDQQDSGLITDVDEDYDHHQQQEPQKQQEVLMRLDSGIDTCTTQLSSLKLKNQFLNDLSSCNKTNTTTSTCTDDKKRINAETISWEKLYQQDEEGDTHLHNAILKGVLDQALAVIRVAPHPFLLDTLNDDAQSPLHLAVATGQWKIARWLIVAGARPSPRNICGDSPLHLAARNGDLDCCRAITDPVQQQERDLLGLRYPPSPYQYCEFDQWNYDGQTCVHLAALNGHVDVLRHLVWYGADINARDGCSGYTALHYAMQRNDEKLVRFLLTECKKLNVHAVTYGGRSALQLGIPVTNILMDALSDRGVSSYLSSEEEDSDSSDEMMYEEQQQQQMNSNFHPSLLVGSSA